MGGGKARLKCSRGVTKRKRNFESNFKTLGKVGGYWVGVFQIWKGTGWGAPGGVYRGIPRLKNRYQILRGAEGTP